MSALVLLIFASLAVATVFLTAFIWAVRSGQYEDPCTPAMRVLMEDAARAGVTTVAPGDTVATPQLALKTAPKPAPAKFSKRPATEV